MEDRQCVQSLQVVQAVVHVADLEGGVASSQRVQEVHRRAALVTAQRCNVLEHANAVRLANSRDEELSLSLSLSWPVANSCCKCGANGVFYLINVY